MAAEGSSSASTPESHHEQQIRVTRQHHSFHKATEDMLEFFHRETHPLQPIEPQRVRKGRTDQFAKQLAVLNRLRRNRDERGSLRNRILSVLLGSEYPQVPHTFELTGLALYFFPPRHTLPVHVYDIYRDHAEHFVIDVGGIEAAWTTKPEGVVVRWLHAPIGVGFLHSTLEDVFRKVSERGRAFSTGCQPNWPYVEFDTLSFRHRENVEDLRDAYCLLSKGKSFQPFLNGELNKYCFEGDHNKSIRTDFHWRMTHFNTEPDYWELAASDIPWQLSDALHYEALGPLSKIVPSPKSKDLGVLSSHRSFRDAQIVRNPFRLFHRNDGFILSMSAAKGVNYLDAMLDEYIHESEDKLILNPRASALGHVMEQFKDHGTSTPGQWHMATVEWFLVHLVTELGVTPHNYRKGHNILGIMDAYQQIYRDLKHQIYDPWRAGETVALTRKFLQCIEEVSMIHDVLTKNLEIFTRLKDDCERFAVEDATNNIEPNNPDGKSSVLRATWALNMVREQVQHAKYLRQHLELSMGTLLQIRNTEQSELAIVRDSQEKTIRLFTGVTVVFLPLSFCTSYFGMNLQGIVNTSKTERYFWAVCGSTALGVVLVIILYVFNDLLRPLFGRKPAKVKAAGI